LPSVPVPPKPEQNERGHAGGREIAPPIHQTESNVKVGLLS
jgi:hypothetical protein